MLDDMLDQFDYSQHIWVAFAGTLHDHLLIDYHYFRTKDAWLTWGKPEWDSFCWIVDENLKYNKLMCRPADWRKVYPIAEEDWSSKSHNFHNLWVQFISEYKKRNPMLVAEDWVSNDKRYKYQPKVTLPNDEVQMKVAMHTEIYMDDIFYQEPDGYDWYRTIMPSFLIPNGLKTNQNPTNTFIGRAQFSNIIIESPVVLKIGEKFNFDKYIGIMPLCASKVGNNIYHYECSIDMVIPGDE